MKKKQIFVYGDNIDTDRIIPGKYTKTLDPRELVAHCFEDLDPNFRTLVKRGALVIAGNHFGCGSSREQAPLAIKESGVALVVARSFARIFFRNAINIGLPLMEIPEHTLTADSDVVYDLAAGRLEDRNQRKTWHVASMPPFLATIVAEGGLVPYLQKRGRYVPS